MYLLPRRIQALLLSVLCSALFWATTAFPLSGGPYDLNWNTIDGGGSTVSTAGDFTLGGTIGQPDAGAVSDGRFTVSGGFWLGGEPSVSSVDPPPPDTTPPLVLRLLGSSPNPFRHLTAIGYEIPAEGTYVRIQVFDPGGRKVAVLVDGLSHPGRHAAVWSGRDTHGQLVASGVYFYRFEAGGESHVGKVIRLD
jgi:hypothetical protein